MVQKADVYLIVKDNSFGIKYFKMKVHAGILCWTEDPYSAQPFQSYDIAKGVVEEWDLRGVVILPVRLYRNCSISQLTSQENSQ